MSDKLTIVRDGGDGGAGYYINGELYTYVHANDFTSEIEDVYQGIMLNRNVTEIEEKEMSEEDFDAIAENHWQFFDKLSDYSFSKEETE